jgi:hypothetical protein
MQNYRPISSLTAFSTILEKLMHNRLLSFLEKHNMLTDVQHGCMDNQKTETASHTFIQSVCVQEALDRHLHDFSKAYDVINHNILLDKLDSYGVRSSSDMSFKSYLPYKTQSVEISQTDK